ncbi:uncharacterized protein HMPREF1541_09254 [Cyphellophora europaea CBS 101466]|uniref:Cytochrome P450 n=1 Tax=Cyphellophora europaea (strain CBS 101466) TaxID=1220924 RepID=W2SBP3_CYPE1|nr:uncharacterized protein HMPREF1541_09254 [Cyphellophora europaea CBS 101466]ETN45423.1 hypothetical protein HMPREF1541_09254 [Cyphellophora europaea CBS 101466]
MYPIIALLAAVTAVYLVLSSYLTRRRHARLAAEWGCQPPIRRRSKWPGGFDFVWEIIKADRTNDLVNLFEDVAKEMSPRTHTWLQAFAGATVINTLEPKNVQAILATQFKDFEFGSVRQGCFYQMFGYGIFSDNGERWEHSRALLRPQFARANIADLDSLERHLQHFMRHFQVDSSGWTQQIDLAPMFFRLSLDGATEFLFGESVDSQLLALPGYEHELTRGDHQSLNTINFSTAFDTGMAYVATKFRINDLHWMYNPPEFLRSIKEVHRFADYFVRKALDSTKSSAGQEKELEGGHKKGRYVFAEELAQATRDPVEMRNQLLHILLAGRDTTAGLLGAIFYRLAENPAIYQKLRQAVVNDFGTYEHPKNMDFAELKACSYLQYVLNEGLRLHPSVPANGRCAVRDTTLPVGGGPDGKSPVFVKKGQEVSYSVHNIQRRKDLFGEDAEEFVPERWIDRKAGWEFVPFNGGPRICLGQQYALTTAGYVVARLVQRFDQLGDLESHGPRYKHAYTVTVAPATAKMRLHEASAH